MASSWFIVKKRKHLNMDIFRAGLGNTASDLMYQLFPLPKRIKDNIHSKKKLEEKEST